MYVLVPFLIIPSAVNSTGTVVVLRCHMFFTYFLQVFVFAYYIIFFSLYVIICTQQHTDWKACFSFILLNQSIWSMVLHFSNSLDIKVTDNSSSFGSWFLLVFTPLFQNPIFHSIYVLSKSIKKSFSIFLW